MTSATASWQPRPIAFSTIREETSSMGSPQVHVPEADRRPAEARVERLSRIGLAAETRLEVEILPDRVDRGPEGRRRQLDDRVPDWVLDLPVLDEIRLTARVLRVVALVVDVPLHEALHVDAELHVLRPHTHADPVWRDERLARLARFASEDAVGLGRVAAGFV